METGQILSYQSPSVTSILGGTHIAQEAGWGEPASGSLQPVGNGEVLQSSGINFLPEQQAATDHSAGFLNLSVEDHLWLVGLLSGLALILALLSCSLRSTYFQENYFFVRAKEWVQLPSLLQQHPSTSAQESLLSGDLESGVEHTHVDDHNIETQPGPAALSDSSQRPPEQQEYAEFCSWVSETDTKNLLDTMKAASDDEKSDSDEIQGPPLSAALDVSNLSLTEKTEVESTSVGEQLSDVAAAAVDEEPAEIKPTSFIAKSHSQFLFGNKSESLDEARSRTDMFLAREKCFKANKSVDEILTKQHPKPGHLPGSEHSQSASPKCRKLQERRGSNHSLTIAVVTAEATLPTVITPRECSATQFLLTAGNSMNRRQLRSCLKDVNAVHAEFCSIPTNVPEAMELVAPRKNRYRYILPNPHSRVKLPSNADPSDPATGYINANFIRDQSGNPRAYIATQGPLSNTIADFWLMIWTERVPAIVMITKLVEAGKAKCEAYLPEEGQSSCQHGNVNIAIESTEETDGYTIRRLVIRVGEDVQRIAHYWYTDWADHKTPENPKTLVQLAVTIETLRRGPGSPGLSTPISREVGPIVVHCSAGVGRTGCFIALCQGLSQLATDGTVDILSIVCTLRCDRGGMVQTAEQYEFIHRGLCLFERSSTLSDFDGN